MESQWNALAYMSVNEFLSKFKNDTTKNAFIDSLKKFFVNKDIYNNEEATDAEVKSWENSLGEMAYVLRDDDIFKKCMIILEFKNLIDDTRADMLICGQSKGENNELIDNVIVIELKQWSKEYNNKLYIRRPKSNKPDECKLIDNNKIIKDNKAVDHPSQQALNYKVSLQNNYKYININNVEVSSCAFMHNYYDNDESTTIIGKYDDLERKSKLFYKEKERYEFVYHFKNYLLDKLSESDIHKSELLAEGIIYSEFTKNPIVRLFNNNSQFRLDWKQHVDFYKILTSVEDKLKSNKKGAVIVSGGPGTGKSTIALQLFKTLKDSKRCCEFVTPNDFFKQSLQFMGKEDEIMKNIKWPSDITDEVDVVICDEANRLKNSERFSEQINVLLDKGNVVIFFQDDDQLLIPDDDGSSERITECCNNKNIEIKTINLYRQYRCGGGNEYINWIDKVLQIKDDTDYQNTDWKFSNYDFRIFDDPKQMLESLQARIDDGVKNNELIDARFLSGNSWHYLSPIEIGNFKIDWNDINIRTWAAQSQPKIKEAGSVQAVQGMDFDYVGVVIGNDLQFSDRVFGSGPDYLYRQGKAGLDSGTFEGQDAIDTYIKRVYKVLLTRGTKGCYIYCCDTNLKKRFEEMLLPHLQEIIK